MIKIKWPFLEIILNLIKLLILLEINCANDIIQPRIAKRIEQNWTLSPNPTNDFININYIGKENFDGILGIYSIDGRKVITNIYNFSSNNVATFDVSNLPEGLYIVTIKNGENDLIFKSKVSIIR